MADKPVQGAGRNNMNDDIKVTVPSERKMTEMGMWEEDS
jgi:hypothetical protein